MSLVLIWQSGSPASSDTFSYVLTGQTSLYPYLKIEVEFATDPTTAAVTWTEITPYVLSFSCRRGRQHDLARIEAGTMDMRLDNRDRRFDPSYAASPYSPNVVPLRRIRVRASWSSVIYPVWQGYVEAWPPSWPDGGKNDVVTLRAVDGFKVLNLSSLRDASFSSEDTGTRISNVLGTVSIPSADYSVGAGSVTLVASGTVSDDTTALGHILEVVDSEGGGAVFYASRGGTFIFENQRHRIANETVSSGTYVDSAGTTGLTYRNLLASYDDADLWNQVTITPSGGTAETIDDATSQTTYFKRALSLSGLHARQGEAAAVASIIVYRQSDPQLRFPAMEVIGAANPSVLWPKLLALELSDRLTVSRTPPGGGAAMSQACHVEAIDHEIGTDHWITRLQLSKADAASTFWVLGTNTLETGTPGIVGY